MGNSASSPRRKGAKSRDSLRSGPGPPGSSPQGQTPRSSRSQAASGTATPARDSGSPGFGSLARVAKALRTPERTSKVLSGPGRTPDSEKRSPLQLADPTATPSPSPLGAAGGTEKRETVLLSEPPLPRLFIAPEAGVPQSSEIGKEDSGGSPGPLAPKDAVGDIPLAAERTDRNAEGNGPDGNGVAWPASVTGQGDVDAVATPSPSRPNTPLLLASDPGTPTPNPIFSQTIAAGVLDPAGVTGTEAQGTADGDHSISPVLPAAGLTDEDVSSPRRLSTMSSSQNRVSVHGNVSGLSYLRSFTSRLSLLQQPSTPTRTSAALDEVDDLEVLTNRNFLEIIEEEETLARNSEPRPVPTSPARAPDSKFDLSGGDLKRIETLPDFVGNGDGPEPLNSQLVPDDESALAGGRRPRSLFVTVGAKPATKEQLRLSLPLILRSHPDGAGSSPFSSDGFRRTRDSTEGFEPDKAGLKEPESGFTVSEVNSVQWRDKDVASLDGSPVQPRGSPGRPRRQSLAASLRELDLLFGSALDSMSLAEDVKDWLRKAADDRTKQLIVTASQHHSESGARESPSSNRHSDGIETFLHLLRNEVDMQVDAYSEKLAQASPMTKQKRRSLLNELTLNVLRTRSIPWLRKFAASGGIRLAAQGLAKEMKIWRGRESVFMPTLQSPEEEHKAHNSERAECWLKIIAAGINAVIAVQEAPRTFTSETSSRGQTEEESTWTFPLLEALDWIACGFPGVAEGSSPIFGPKRNRSERAGDPYGVSFGDVLGMDIPLLPTQRVRRLSRADLDLVQHLSLVDLLSSVFQAPDELANGETRRLVMEIFAAAAVLGEESARLVWDKLGRVRRWTDGDAASDIPFLAKIVAKVSSAAVDLAKYSSALEKAKGPVGLRVPFPNLGGALGAAELCNALVIGVADAKDFEESTSLLSLASLSSSVAPTPFASPVLHILPKHESPGHLLARRMRRRMELERHGFFQTIEDINSVINKVLIPPHSDSSSSDVYESARQQVAEMRFQINTCLDLSARDKNAILSMAGAGSDADLEALASLVGIDMSGSDLGNNEGVLFQSAVLAALASLAAAKGMPLNIETPPALQRSQGSRSTLLGRLLGADTERTDVVAADETRISITPASSAHSLDSNTCFEGHPMDSKDTKTAMDLRITGLVGSEATAFDDEEEATSKGTGSDRVNMKIQIREALKHISVAQDRLLQAYKEEDERGGQLGPLSEEEIAVILRMRAKASSISEPVHAVLSTPIVADEAKPEVDLAAVESTQSAVVSADQHEKASRDGEEWLPGVATGAADEEGKLAHLSLAHRRLPKVMQQKQAAILYQHRLCLRLS